MPTLASCSFYMHGLILIMFGKQRQHTFKNDMRVQLSLSLHFYLLYLLLNGCNGTDAFWRHSVLVKQSSCFGRKHRTLSPQICVCQTVQLTYRICGLMQERVFIEQTRVRDTSHCDQRLEAAPHWYMDSYHKTSSMKQLVNGESGCMLAWGKRHHYEHLLN